jgi:hypothetical protein
MTSPLSERTELGGASGWQLARGDMTPARRFERQAESVRQESEGLPRKRFWAYFGLALPALLLLAALAGAFGSLSARGAGRGLLLLGLTGAIVMLAAASVNYVDDIMSKSRQELAQAAANPANAKARSEAARSLDQAETNMRKAIVTGTTPYLWASLAMYGLIAACGVAAKAPQRTGLPARVASFQHDAGSSQLPAQRPSVELPLGLPDFGPNLHQAGRGRSSGPPSQTHP